MLPVGLVTSPRRLVGHVILARPGQGYLKSIMDLALDRYTDPLRLVPAAEAAHDQHRYLCPHPQCQRPVYRAEGEVQSPHFKHFPNSGADDCPYYQFSSWEASPEGLRQKAARRRRQPALLAALSRRGSDLKWKLLLYTPPLEGDQALAEISEPAGVRTLSAEQLSGHGRRLDVRPHEGTYRVTVLDATAHEVARYDIPGLRRGVPNVFRFAEAGGRRLTTGATGERESVVLGAPYLVVTHFEHSLAAAPPDVRVRFLGSDGSGQWTGTFLQLPGKESKPLRSWCEHHLRRPLATPQPELVPVFPPHSQPLADETMEVPVDQKIVLALHAQPGTPAPGRIVIWDASAQNPYQLFLSGTLPAFIALGPLRAGVYEVLVPEEPDLYLELRAVKRPTLAPPEEAVLQAQDAAATGTQTAPLFSQAAEELLRAVRTSRWHLSAIRLPAALPVTLRTREDTMPWQEDERRPLGTNAGAFEAQIAERLGRLLAQSRLELVIDVGAFGHAELRRPARTAPVRSPARLPQRLRTRLRWLLGAAHANGLAVPAGIKLATPVRLTGADRQLVDQLLCKPTWPLTLLPQVHAAFRELNCYTERSLP
jgi:hypothetical protein